MTLKQKKAARTVVATGVAKMDAAIKKTLWYTVAIPIIVQNPAAVHTDMTMLVANTVKLIMFITITIKGSRTAMQKRNKASEFICSEASFILQGRIY